MPKQKHTIYSTANFIWLTCPHCKKLVIGSAKETIATLTKWKKQKISSKKK